MLIFKRILIYFLLIILSISFMAPIYGMILISFKTMSDTIMNPWALPKGISAFVSNIKGLYFGVEGRTGFLYNMLTSFKITIPSVIIVIIFSMLLAYPLARKKFRFRNIILNFIIIGIAIPYISLVIPIFKLVNTAHLYDSILGLIWIYSGFTIPFAVFLFRNYMILIPIEIEEAALIDGANNWHILIKIIIPLCKPVIAAMIIFGFTWIFNDFFYALVLTYSKVRTATVAISLLQASEAKILNWPVQMTAALATSLPTLIVFLAFQKYFIKGIFLGSVKG